jgi:hypothetical protein
MFRKNGFVEVAVGPPVFIVANAPSGSPNTWSLGMTRPTESLKATPAAAATSNAVIAAMRHRLLVSFLVVRAWFEGWPFWAIGEPVWAGIEFPFNCNVVACGSQRSAEASVAKLSQG